MKLFIPTIGTNLLLTDDWTFYLQEEHRNSSVFKALQPDMVVTEQDVEFSTWLPPKNQSNYHKIIQDSLDPVHNGTHCHFVQETKRVASTYSWASEIMYVRRKWYEAKGAFVTLEKDTVLNVERIYIRQNKGDFDSITFTVQQSNDLRLLPKKQRGFLTGRARFWAKLDDVNKINCEVV